MQVVLNWFHAEWWWLHFVLLGLLLGRSIGMWAYRDVWFALSTFLSGPADTSGVFRMLRQWAAALILALPAAVTVALDLTAPTTFSAIEDDRMRLGVVVGGIIVWLVAIYLRTLLRARVQGEPSPFGNPLRWARFRANESPDTIVVVWLDTLLGGVLHGGLLAGWVWLDLTARTGPWWQVVGYTVSVTIVLLTVTISLLLHPRPVSHEDE